MGASVRIEDEAFSDSRYFELAEYAGLADADHARGKMEHLWRQCTLETTYVLPNQVVCRYLGTDGVSAIVRARLGVLVGADHVRIRGTRGRIEWLKKLRDNGKKGGRPKGYRNKPSGSGGGNPSGSPPNNPPTSAPTSTSVLNPPSEDIGERAPPARPKPKGKPLVAMPVGWMPSAGVASSDEGELAQFRDHHAARGSRFVDWDAAWRTWQRNAAKFSRGSPAPPRQTALDAQLERVARLEREEREAEERPS